MHYKKIISSPLLKSSLKTFEKPSVVYILNYHLDFKGFCFFKFFNHIAFLRSCIFIHTQIKKHEIPYMPREMLFKDEGSTSIFIK